MPSLSKSLQSNINLALYSHNNNSNNRNHSISPQRVRNSLNVHHNFITILPFNLESKDKSINTIKHPSNSYSDIIMMHTKQATINIRTQIKTSKIIKLLGQNTNLNCKKIFSDRGSDTSGHHSTADFDRMREVSLTKCGQRRFLDGRRRRPILISNCRI